MERLGNYELSGALSNENAGCSVWGFGKKDGKDYFIKQFLTPKYPANDTVSSPERLQKKAKECAQFEQRKVAVYKMLNENSDGNAVRVEEFFRIESKYYISMQKIEALPWSVENVAALSQRAVRSLCAIIAHAIAGIHQGHVVHADLKHDNILFMQTPAGYITAKIIDFDSSFLETDPPLAGDEIVGDLVYFSPEACRSIWGEEMKLTCKMDIFALGVLFHQYFTGELPEFNTEQSSYPGEAVAKGELLTVSYKLPSDIYDLLVRMLNPDPELRPTAMDVFNSLRGIIQADGVEASTTVDTIDVETEYVFTDVTIEESTLSSNPFYCPGDL